jgi:hypothetical protein
MTSPLRPLMRNTRLALQEFAPHMAVLMLPGGYVIALTGWVHRHWPLLAMHLRNFGRRLELRTRSAVVDER